MRELRSCFADQMLVVVGSDISAVLQPCLHILGLPDSKIAGLGSDLVCHPEPKSSTATPPQVIFEIGDNGEALATAVALPFHVSEVREVVRPLRAAWRLFHEIFHPFCIAIRSHGDVMICKKVCNGLWHEYLYPEADALPNGRWCLLPSPSCQRQWGKLSVSFMIVPPSLQTLVLTALKSAAKGSFHAAGLR